MPGFGSFVFVVVAVVVVIIVVVVVVVAIVVVVVVFVVPQDLRSSVDAFITDLGFVSPAARFTRLSYGPYPNLFFHVF